MANSDHESFELTQRPMPSEWDGSGASEREPLMEGPLDEDPYSSVRFGTIQLFQPWFPEVDPSDRRSQGWLRKLSDRSVALLIHQVVAITVLALNCSVAVYALHKNGFSSNIGNLLEIEGKTCEEVKQYNRWLHFAINGFSTILLGSSNYCAQLLVAPTREDVNKAHQQKKWFDIGVQSISNLRKIDRKRRILWLCLMFSSGMLHLIWNSAVFMAFPVSQNSVALVTSDFSNDENPWKGSSLELLKLKNATHPEHLSPEDCIKRYAGQKAGLLDVLVVSSNITMNHDLSFATNSKSSLLFNFTVGGGVDWAIAGSWMCSARAKPGEITKTFCTEQSLLPKAANWTYFGMHFDDKNHLDKAFWSKVDHCITAENPRSMDDKCALRLSSVILLLVCILNVMKCACICYTAQLHFKKQKAARTAGFQPITPYLVTIGDAVASFLETPDEETQSMQLVDKRHFTQNRWPNGQSARKPQEHRWFWAATARRWLITISLCIIMLVVVSVLLAMTIKSQKDHGISIDISALWRYGLGGTQLWATALTGLMRKMNFTAGFFFATLFANLFQVIVSALYLLYNNLLTVMLVAAEWNKFASERKTLRVSCPRGIQRSNYFLSLPYKYSISLMICSGLLHWLISQSVFVIQTVGYKAPDFEPDSTLDASVIGYSSIGIILSMILGGTMVVFLVMIGYFFKYQPKKLRDILEQEDPTYPMPLVSTCSAAISAACHRHAKDKDAHLLPVRWGYVIDVADEHSRPGDGRFRFSTARIVQYPDAQNVGMDCSH